MWRILRPASLTALLVLAASWAVLAQAQRQPNPPAKPQQAKPEAKPPQS